MSIILNEIWVMERKAAGSYVSGVYVDGPVATYTLKGNAQPLTGEDIMVTPEANRDKKGIKIFTYFQLQNDDILYRPGSTLSYKVMETEDWDYFGGASHYKSIMYLEENQENE